MTCCSARGCGCGSGGGGGCDSGGGGGGGGGGSCSLRCGGAAVTSFAPPALPARIGGAPRVARSPPRRRALRMDTAPGTPPEGSTPPPPPPPPPRLSRRALLQAAAAGAAVAATAGVVVGAPPPADAVVFPSFPSAVMAAARAGARPGGRVPSYTVFRVAPAEAVTLLPLSTSEALDDLTAARVVFVGEHHLSLVDHQTTANVVDALARRRSAAAAAAEGDAPADVSAANPAASAAAAAAAGPVALGLECINTCMQGVVDEYIAGRLSEEGLYEAVEWDARWGWPFEAYLPLLRMAKRRHMPIVALGVNAELIHGVVHPAGWGGAPSTSAAATGGKASPSSRTAVTAATAAAAAGRRGGVDLGAIPPADRERLVSALGGEAAFPLEPPLPGWPSYVDATIRRSFAVHRRLGHLRTATDADAYERFYTGRLVQDAGIAAAAAAWAAAHPGGQLVAVMGGEHLHFGYGTPWRTQQLVSAQLQRAAAAAAAAASSTAAETAVAAVPPAGGPTAVAAAAAAVAPPPPLASPRQAVAAAAAAAAASFPVRTVLVNPAPGDANDGGGALRLALAPPPGGAPPQPIADMLWFSAPVGGTGGAAAAAKAAARSQGGAWWHWLRRSLPPLEDLRV